PGEPYIRERTFATRRFTENAERESARRFSMRVAKFAGIQRVCGDEHVVRDGPRRLSGST
ncbi:MAG: hypothetical protein ABGZ35_27910, partial [Planctomycetaceae bacterium]